MTHSRHNAAAGIMPGAHLSRTDFVRVADFVHTATGILLPPMKHTLMEGRLRRRLRATGLEDFGAYCDYLFSPTGQAQEAVHLINALTTNKTDFFREPEHFNALAEQILPGIIRAAGRPRTLKFWSAASSIGAEAYTIAMVTASILRQHSGWRFAVLGTDISTDVLQTAAAGIFPDQMIAPVPMKFRQAYLLRSRDAASGMVRIAPQLRAHMRFAQLNLMQDHYEVDQDFDVVFCRNVLIYFDRDTQNRVVRQLAGHLRPGGVLILGHSETAAGAALKLRPLGQTMFQRDC